MEEGILREREKKNIRLYSSTQKIFIHVFFDRSQIKNKSEKKNVISGLQLYEERRSVLVNIIIFKAVIQSSHL